MERKNPIPLSPRRLPQYAELHEVLDEPIRRCRSYVQQTANVGSSELRCFVELDSLVSTWLV